MAFRSDDHAAEVRLGGVQHDLELQRIEPQQHVALLDALAFMHRHRGHDAGDVGGNRLLGRAHIGVVDRDVASAGEPVGAGSDGHHDDAAQHQERAEQRAADAAAADRAPRRRAAPGPAVAACDITRPPALRLRPGCSGAAGGLRGSGSVFIVQQGFRHRIDCCVVEAARSPARASARAGGRSRAAPGMAGGQRCRRQMRRSFGSGRRSTMPRASSRSISRATVIGSTSRISDEFLLRQARLALQPDQDAPLRAGHAVRAGALVGVHAQQPGDVVQQEHQVTLEIVHWQGQSFGPGADHKRAL